MRFYKDFVVEFETENGVVEASCDFYFSSFKERHDDLEIEITKIEVEGVDITLTIPYYEYNRLESYLFEIMLSSGWN